MKKMSVNILCGTGLTLILLAVVGIVFNARSLCIESIFQAFLANVIIHIGLLFTRKFECSFAALEFALDIGYITSVVLIFGGIFDWYASVPIWALVIITAAAYFISVLLSLVRTRGEVNEINKLLKRRMAKEEKQCP